MLILGDRDKTGLSYKNATKWLRQVVMKYKTSYVEATNKSSQADTGQEWIYGEVYAKKNPTSFAWKNFFLAAIDTLLVYSNYTHSRLQVNLNCISMTVRWFH